jgi:hypothetical protein
MKKIGVTASFNVEEEGEKWRTANGENENGLGVASAMKIIVKIIGAGIKKHALSICSTKNISQKLSII